MMLNKMIDISQTVFWNKFHWEKILGFWFDFTEVFEISLADGYLSMKPTYIISMI